MRAPEVMMDGFGWIGAALLVASAVPGLAPGFARRFKAAALFAAAGIGSLILFAIYDHGVGTISWWCALIGGFILASAAERCDRREAQRRTEHAELLAEIRALRGAP